MPNIRVLDDNERSDLDSIGVPVQRVFSSSNIDPEYFERPKPKKKRKRPTESSHSPSPQRQRSRSQTPQPPPSPLRPPPNQFFSASDLLNNDGTGPSSNQPEDEFQTVPPCDYDWEEFDAIDEERFSHFPLPEGESYDPEFCFLCYCTIELKEMSNDHNVKAMVDLIRDHWEKTDIKAHMTQIQSYYEKNVMPLINNLKLRRPWRRKIIFQHFDIHIVDTKVLIEETLKAFNAGIRTIRDSGMFSCSTKTGEIRVNMDKAMAFKQLSQYAIGFLIPQAEKFRNNKLV